MLFFAAFAGSFFVFLAPVPVPPFTQGKLLVGYVFGWLLLLLFTFHAGRYLVRLVRRPMFRIGVLGIQIGTNPPDPWRGILNEQVIVSIGKTRQVVLSYWTPHANQRLNVSEYAISADHLRELLVYYRQRALDSPAVSN